MQIEEKNHSKQEHIARLQKEVVEGTIRNSPTKKAEFEKDDIWNLAQGARNKYFAEKIFNDQASKKNNLAKPAPEIDQVLKIPKFMQSSSFEGLALSVMNGNW